MGRKKGRHFVAEPSQKETNRGMGNLIFPDGLVVWLGGLEI